MKTAKPTPPSSSVEITLPTSWQQLDDTTLRYVITLLTEGMTHDAVKTYLLYRLAGSADLTTVGSQQLAIATTALDFIDQPPSVPVRITQWQGHKAFRADLQGLPFQSYLQIENLYQGYLMSKNPEALTIIGTVLYDGLRTSDHVFHYNILMWIAGVKALFTDKWPHLFRSADATTLDTPDMEEIMNAEIRALTGGDITKESVILQSDCWRALTELNEKARESQKLKHIKN